MEVPYSLSTLTVPLDLKCPLSNRVFVDPVTAADGYTYERASILKHLDTSLKSPTSGMLLLHINLVPNSRKQLAAQQWISAAGNAAFQHASKCAHATESGTNQDQEALDTLVQLKELIGNDAFFENIEWPNLVMTVAERMLQPFYTSVTPGTSSVDKPDEAQAKLGPLRILYDIYLAYYLQDAECPYKDDFVRVRTELSKCYFALGEHGQLEALLHKHKVFNTAPLWRILVNEQVSFGWKKVAAKSCLSMAKFAEANGLDALAATSREEAFELDPNIKPDGSEFGTVSFMTKEELRLATREEIVSSFKVDPNSQLNYEHLVDFLEDEGAIVSAVRVIVAHSLMKNVPVQYQATTALPMRRLVTLVAHLQSKYIPQLQILSTEANNYRVQAGLQPLSPPDLESLMKQATNEEEYKPIVAGLLETIQGKITPPVSAGSAASGASSAASGSAVPIVSSSPTVASSVAPLSSINSPPKAALRSSWGIKPGQGKDRNKRFTMGIKTQSGGGFLGSRGGASGSGGTSGFGTSPYGTFGQQITPDFLQQPATSGSAALGPSDPNTRTNSPGPGRPPANFVWGPNTTKVGPPPAIGENPMFSQPLVPPSRLHTFSTLTPFDGDSVLSVTSDGLPGPASPMVFEGEDSPFSSTVFNSMPDSLSTTPTTGSTPLNPGSAAAGEAPSAENTSTQTSVFSLSSVTSAPYGMPANTATTTTPAFTGLNASSSSLDSSNSSLPSYGSLSTSSSLLGTPAPLLAGSNLGGSSPSLPVSNPLLVSAGMSNRGFIASSSNPMLATSTSSPGLNPVIGSSLPSNPSLLGVPASSGLLPTLSPLLPPSGLLVNSGSSGSLAIGSSLPSNSLTPPMTQSQTGMVGGASPVRSPSPLTGPTLTGSSPYGYTAVGYTPVFGSSGVYNNPALAGSNPGLFSNSVLSTLPTSSSPTLGISSTQSGLPSATSLAGAGSTAGSTATPMFSGFSSPQGSLGYSPTAPGQTTPMTQPSLYQTPQNATGRQ